MTFSADTLFWVMIGLQVAVILLCGFVAIRCLALKFVRNSEYWTDYRHKDIIMRIYKWEFETQALEQLHRWQVLDRGDLTPQYRWILFTINNKRNEKRRN